MSDAEGVDPDTFRAALSSLPTGVVVVTTWLGARPWGMTVSACCSISVAPPRVLVSLRRDSVSHAHVCEQRRLGVNILGCGGKEVAELAARPGSPKFLDEHCVPGSVPRIRGALRHLGCTVDDMFVVGDHSLVVARVEELDEAPVSADPLLYFDRGYRRLGRRL
jgi:flavin reductase (DIM6/NTAB) family NADH-FMN oxidoreductase RutF